MNEHLTIIRLFRLRCLEGNNNCFRSGHFPIKQESGGLYQNYYSDEKSLKVEKYFKL